MSLKLKKNDNYLEIIEGDLPSKEEFRVFTEDEVLQFEGWKQWMTLSEEAREGENWGDALDNLIVENE